MSFAHPWVLSLLLALPALFWYDQAWGLKARARFRFSSFSLFGERPPGRWHALRALSVLRLVGLGLLIVALARPQKGQKGEEVLSPGTDIVLTLDTSGSMETPDFAPKNRLDAAKDVIAAFIKTRKHDRLGLVVFSGLAYTQCPLTVDYNALLTFLDHVRTRMIQPDSTAIGTALLTAVARLKGSEAKSKVIILLTDGQNNHGAVDPVTAAKIAAQENIKIYTVGAGAPDSPDGLDEGALREVAAVTGAQYFRATDISSLKKTYREIDKLEKTDIKVLTFTDYQDVYLPWLLVALALLLAELTLSQTLWRRLP